jgi:hypothetical protein
MDDLSRRLEKLGAAVADVSDRAADRAAIDGARRAFLAPAARAPRAGNGFWRLWTPVRVGFAVACLAALMLLGWSAATPRPLSFSAAATGAPGPARPGVVGEWVAASGDAPLEVRFSDASTLALAPGARMRVTTTNPRGADVLIERGAVHAVIAHVGRSARWGLRAGPFEVRVTGTTFDASWDPTSETFELVMTEGSVSVAGPLIPPDRTVVAGERLRVSIRDGRMELRVGAAEPAAAIPQDTVAVAPPPAPSAAPAAPRDPQQPRAQVAVASSAAPAAPGWKELAAAGKYRDALAAAEASGFARELERASSGDALLLADAARLGGSPARAREALLSARGRFGARGHTAFLLGKIAADQSGAPADAVSWFEVYLREAPGGPFAEQALGRIIDLDRRRDPGAATAAAKRYLARYPNGSYAALARSVAPPDASPEPR